MYPALEVGMDEAQMVGALMDLLEADLERGEDESVGGPALTGARIESFRRGRRPVLERGSRAPPRERHDVPDHGRAVEMTGRLLIRPGRHRNREQRMCTLSARAGLVGSLANSTMHD